jgi:hypothetical protein
VFRDVDRIDYGGQIDTQLVEAAAAKGPGDLARLLDSGSTWTVE